MLNKSGKTLTIFVILIIILLLSSTGIGFFLYHNEERLHKVVETERDRSRADVLKLQAQVKDIQGQLALAQDKDKEANQKINSLLDERDLDEGVRAALKKENAHLKEQMDAVEASNQKIKSELNDSAAKVSQFQQLLDASQIKTKEFESRLAELVQTNKNLTQNNKGLQAKVDELQALMKPYDKRTPEQQIAGEDLPPATGKDKVELDKIVVAPNNGTQGHILSIDTDAEFVVFNLGLNQGIKPDAILSVYRGDDYLGDIKATRVQDEMSAADIIPPLSSRELRKNDTVVLKP